MGVGNSWEKDFFFITKKGRKFKMKKSTFDVEGERKKEENFLLCVEIFD